MARKQKRDPLAEEVIADLERGRHIYESFIASEGDAWVEGSAHEGKVWVNPAPNLLEIAFHEILHRLYPSMSERRVIAQSRRILRELPDAEVERLYHVYQRVAKKVKRKGRRSA